MKKIYVASVLGIALALSSLSAHAVEANLHLVIDESKIVFSTFVRSFQVQVKDRGTDLEMYCHNREVYMGGKKDLFQGWNVKNADQYNAYDADSESYLFTACRSAEHEVLGWFPKFDEHAMTIPEELIDKDYNAKKKPLLLRVKSLADDAASYFSCDSGFSKTLVKESDKAKTFDAKINCKPVANPGAKATGLVDFVDQPGPFAAVASYRMWMLPSVAGNAKSFARVKSALLKKIPLGKYTGVMTTLSKTCDVEIAARGDSLLVKHTINSSGNTRELELKAEDLYGFVEGDVYSDLIRIEKDASGSLAAAEFRRAKKPPTIVRFEKNTDKEGLIVRIDGSTTYCRRLTKK